MTDDGPNITMISSLLFLLDHLTAVKAPVSIRQNVEGHEKWVDPRLVAT